MSRRAATRRKAIASKLVGPLAAALAGAVVGSAGCGSAPGLAVGLELRLDALSGEEVLQFVVVSGEDVDREPVYCGDLLDRCVASQRDRLRIVPLELDERETPAWQVPLDLEAARSPAGQAVVIPGIPAGRGYLLVVEVLEAGVRTAAGCAEVEVVTPGENDPLKDPVVVEEAEACEAALQ